VKEDIVRKVQANAKYQELVKKRSSFGWLLTALMMVVYYGYILVIAFDKELLAVRLGEGVMTWGIPVGFGIIVFTVIITGIYVRRANSEFDDMTKSILREVK
jgi:uncharacterized membrane protein (DUF485 family)